MPTTFTGTTALVKPGVCDGSDGMHHNIQARFPYGWLWHTVKVGMTRTLVRHASRFCKLSQLPHARPSMCPNTSSLVLPGVKRLKGRIEGNKNPIGNSDSGPSCCHRRRSPNDTQPVFQANAHI